MNDYKKRRDIPGYEGLYSITPDGKVWGYARHRSKTGWRKVSVNKNGYLRIRLRSNGKYFNAAIHRLVAQTYLPNPNALPQVNHINGIKEDNRVENLEWCTDIYNKRHAISTGLFSASSCARGSAAGPAKLTEADVAVIKRRLQSETIYAVAKSYPVTWPAVKAIKAGRTWRHVNA